MLPPPPPRRLDKSEMNTVDRLVREITSLNQPDIKPKKPPPPPPAALKPKIDPDPNPPSGTLKPSRTAPKPPCKNSKKEHIYDIPTV